MDAINHMSITRSVSLSQAVSKCLGRNLDPLAENSFPKPTIVTLSIYRLSKPNVRSFSPSCKNRGPCRAADGSRQE